MRPSGVGALALVLVQIVPALCQTVAPGQGVSCPHATANTQGFFCYDTPSSQFQFDCANFNSQICNCDPSGSIFYTYTVQNCCFKCGCCIKGASPPPPAFPPTAPPPPTRPPPALPSNVEDWFTLVVGVYYIPSFNMKETHSIKVPDQTGYSQANLDRALKWCTTTGAAEMDAAYPENKPYRIYAVGYHGPDGPNCGCDIYTCLQGNNPHPCQTQSSVNRWECNYNRPMNDGVSPNNPDGAVYGTGFPSCEHDLTFNYVPLNMPGCFYEGQSQGYIWFRPPLISDPWLYSIYAGTQTNPLVMPNSTASTTVGTSISTCVHHAATGSARPPGRDADVLCGADCGLLVGHDGATETGTTDVYIAKIMCLDNYFCTGITSNAPGIAIWQMVYTCRTNPVGCQTPRGTNGVSSIAESYYRFDPDGQHGCWLEAPPAAPPAPPSPPPPRQCANLLTDHECRTNYRFAGLCHTTEALRDCALTCGRCHDGCMNREFAWSGWNGAGTTGEDYMASCQVAGALQCLNNVGFQETADVLGGPGNTPNGIADGIDSVHQQPWHRVRGVVSL